MGHLSLDELDEILQEAGRHVAVGKQYRHYKGQTYTVLMVAILETTDEPAVVYRADYDTRLTFVRALSDWPATIEVDGKQMPRFRRITNK